MFYGWIFSPLLMFWVHEVKFKTTTKPCVYLSQFKTETKPWCLSLWWVGWEEQEFIAQCWIVCFVFSCYLCSIRLGIFLRRYPIARVFVIIYMVSQLSWMRDFCSQFICQYVLNGKIDVQKAVVNNSVWIFGKWTK